MVQMNYGGLSESGGVYAVFNNHNQRIYIGSCKHFWTRWNQGHLKTLLSNKHSNKFLQADFNKLKQELSHDNFLEFHILANMPGSTKEERLLKEEEWLKIYFDNGKRCYNLCDRAISREGIPAKDPEETRRKLSIAMTGRIRTEKHRKNLSIALTGKKLSEETRRKISEVQKGRKQSTETIAKRILLLRGKIRTPEQRQRLSAAKKGKSNGLLGKKGRPLTKEHKEKMLKALLAKPPWNKGKTYHTGYIMSEENKKKLREANINRRYDDPWNKGKKGVQIAWNKGKKTGLVPHNKGKCKLGAKAVICIETGEVFSCVGCAGRAKGINSGNLYNVLTGKHETAGGFHWKYV